MKARNIVVALAFILCGGIGESILARGSIGFISGIDSIEDSHSIILAGEVHYSYGNDEIQFQLFDHLVRTQNVHTLLLECGMGSAYVINKYLATGDRNLWFIEPYYTTNRFFLDSLRALEMRLRATDKFEVHGIDYEKNISALLWALQDLLRESNLIDSIRKTPKDYRTFFIEFCNDSNVEFKFKGKAFECLDSMVLAYDMTKDYLKKFLSQNFEQFAKLIENYRESIPLYGGNFENSNCSVEEEREKLMYHNVIMINAKDRMFGQFGILHVTLRKQEAWWNRKEGWYSFSAMLNCEIESPYHDKICCIEIIYPNFNKRRHWKRYQTLGYSKSGLAQIFSSCSKGTCSITSTKHMNDGIYENKYQYILVNRVFDN